MSDDTPTQRFTPAGDAPTQRLSATPAEDVPLEVAEERRSRRLMIILAIAGGVLLLGVSVVLILLLTRGNAPGSLPNSSPSATSSSTPTASPTPSVTPTSTPAPTPTQPAPPPPPPPSNDVTIDTFTASTTSECSSQTQNPVYVDISWASTNGIAAYFGVNTDDAQANGMGWTLPPSGNQNDFPNGYVPYEFQCGNDSIQYTVTVVGTNGSKESKSVTVENTGDQF